MSIFDEQITRKPDFYPWTEHCVRAMWEVFWTDAEFSFASDKQDFYTKLTDKEKEIIIKTLSAIGQIEIAVKTFWIKLGDNLPHPSIRDMGIVMGNSEVIHNMAQERLLEELDLTAMFEENLKLDCISGRVNYLRKYTKKFHSDNKKQFIYSLILFTLFIENVSLFSQFYIIGWFSKKNVLKDTCQQTNYIMKEERIHAQIGNKLINTIRDEHPELFDIDLENRIYSESLEAYNAESKIVDWMIGDTNDEKLNAPLLKEFIKNRINESLEDIGYKKVFDVDNELLKKSNWFNEENLGNSQTDFFHSRPVEYSKHNQSFDPESIFE